MGRVWAMRRPLVYRTLDVLGERELVRAAGTEPSESGPPRTVLDVTADGRERVEAWLLAPVEHVRDARADLMLKLLFLDRAGRDPAPLLRAQRERFALIAAELEKAEEAGLRAHAGALAAREHPRRDPVRRRAAQLITRALRGAKDANARAPRSSPSALATSATSGPTRTRVRPRSGVIEPTVPAITLPVAGRSARHR